MSISSEIARLQQAKSDLATSIANKGVTVPAATTIDGYAALVDSIPSGSVNMYDVVNNDIHVITPYSSGYNSSYCAFFNFETGKTYKIIIKSRNLPTGRLVIYAYQGNANTPNVGVGELNSSNQIKEITYTHTATSTYTRLGIYATVSSERSSNFACHAYIKEVT